LLEQLKVGTEQPAPKATALRKRLEVDSGLDAPPVSRAMRIGEVDA
jgi:hypothetical protein